MTENRFEEDLAISQLLSCHFTPLSDERKKQDKNRFKSSFTGTFQYGSECYICDQDEVICLINPDNKTDYSIPIRGMTFDEIDPPALKRYREGIKL